MVSEYKVPSFNSIKLLEFFVSSNMHEMHVIVVCVYDDHITNYLITREDCPCQGLIEEHTPSHHADHTPHPLEQTVTCSNPICYHQEPGHPNQPNIVCQHNI